MFGMPPTAYRAAHPPAAEVARVPACVRARLRPAAGAHVSRRRRPAASRWTGSSPPPGHNPTQTRSTGMISIATTQLWVHDQDEALKYWTEKVGFEVRADVTVPEMGNFRWLTVGPARAARRRHRADGDPRAADDRRRDRRPAARPDRQGAGRHGVPHHRRLLARATTSMKERGVEFVGEPERADVRHRRGLPRPVRQQRADGEPQRRLRSLTRSSISRSDGGPNPIRS